MNKKLVLAAALTFGIIGLIGAHVVKAQEAVDNTQAAVDNTAVDNMAVDNAAMDNSAPVTENAANTDAGTNAAAVDAK
ncbi:MAG: hypothetical protein HQL13_01970 [Candidatus Omnitrophica bacterium]|nr:hypothetical protein [Candidatus Omnitrophota bacterium]